MHTIYDCYPYDLTLKYFWILRKNIALFKVGSTIVMNKPAGRSPLLAYGGPSRQEFIPLPGSVPKVCGGWVVC